MLGSIIGIPLLLVITVGLAVGVRAAWRSSRPLIRWPLAIVGGLLFLVLLVVSGASIKGAFDVYTTHGRPVQAMDVDRSAERVARGQHVANALCATCHTVTSQLPLSGGRNLSEEIHVPLGNLTPYNLTPAGPLKDWSDGEIFRAVREGVDRTGKKLLVMSAQNARYLSDDDLKSVIAFVRSQPTVSNDVAAEELSFLGVVLDGAKMVPHISSEPPLTVTAPPRTPTADYGKYIVSWFGCRECHGAALNGTDGGMLPPGPSLRVTKGWTAAQFISTLRTGVDPFGKKLDPALMPYKFVSRLDDDELTAVYAYLQSLDIPLKK